MWRLGIKNSYTMEATFGGSTLGDRRGTHFTTRDLKSLGFYFCDTLLDYCDPDPSKTIYCLTELAALLTKKVRERLGKDLGTDCNFSLSDLETSTSGSNSSDSDGLPAHLLNQPHTGPPEFPSLFPKQQTPVKKKKKRLRSRKQRNRLRPERVKSTTQPKVLPSGTRDIESELPSEDSVKEIAQETVQERPVGRHRKKWLLNGQIRKAVIPPPASHPGEICQVTVWKGCEPVKLLPISALLPPLSSFIHSNRQHHRCTQTSFSTYKVHAGLLPSLTAPHRSPMRLLSGFSPDRFNAHIYGDRNALRISECFFAPEDSSNSHADMTKRPNEERCKRKVFLYSHCFLFM
ncbi:Cytosolic carboxypeptidase 2 [Liparis tanakae]|uniref:Cytosolic carboxypeptidase 2 n=1 Tax=Liparis tanakae TaxID=230148 RepID=A0A4Z2H2T9_9TELE|nr:Cytosolic carboxypeptidase 2 [Liparis tanakae]